MDELEIYRRRAKGKWAALKRLGVTNTHCICGETDPLCFEADHLDRRANSDVVWGVCVNCHRKKSAREQSEHPPVGIHPGDPFEGIGHALLGMHQYLSFIAERLPAMADVMFKLAGKGIVIDD